MTTPKIRVVSKSFYSPRQNKAWGGQNKEQTFSNFTFMLQIFFISCSRYKSRPIKTTFREFSVLFSFVLAHRKKKSRLWIGRREIVEKIK